MKLSSTIWLLGWLLIGLMQPAAAQWQNGSLAVRTNGTTFQSGDEVRVELIALEPITQSFSTQVVYGYTETVDEKDEDGNVTKKQVERTRKREFGPQIENFGKHQTLLLDDRFHFGDASPAGWYEVCVNIFEAYSGRYLTTLRTCVFHQNPGVESQSKAECGLFLRSLKRVNNEMFWTFDGWFGNDGRYSILLLQGGKVIRHMRAGGYRNGSREFNVSAPELEGTGGHTFDILVHDHQSERSSTLVKVAVPEAQ
jgi:hypothetical protein